jgi:hypothetical protein
MASVTEPSSSSTITAAPRPEERLVDEQLRLTRRSLKFVDFASGLITLVIGVLAFLLCVSVLEHWVIPGGWGSAGRTVLFVTLLVGIAWYCWQTFWPLVSRSINPAYAAQLIERNSPSLKNSLLNFLLLRNRRQQMSQKVYQAIEQQAAQRLSEVSIDSVIDRSALVRLGYVLVAVVAVCVVYRVLSPKNLTTSIERVLLPWANVAVPSRVEITNITPGETQIARGELLEVTAEVLGIRDGEQVKVRWSTLDGQSVDREATLSASAGSSRFQGRLPDRLSGGENGGVQQDLEYWIEAGDAKSPKYRVTVFARPTLVVEKIRYQFPAYTGLPPREAEGTGDIHALEGTKVTLYALANHDIASAQVDFNADGKHDLAMSAEKTKASAQFTLALRDDRRTPEFDNYVLQYKTMSGRTSSLPPRYSIDVTPDYAPEIELLAPVNEDGQLVEQLDVPVDVPFTVEVEARDPDFALANVVVLGEVAGEQVVRHDLLTQKQTGKFIGKMTATPEELGLKPGDVLEYWAAAVDNREPEPNTAQTDRLRIRVLGKPEFNSQKGQGEQPQGGGQGESGDQGDQGESGESGEGLAGGGEGQEGQKGEGQRGSGGQSGQGESQGEQQGQGGQGGGEGEQSEQQQSQGGGGESGEGESGESGSQQDGSKQNESQQSESQEGGSQQSGSQSKPGGEGSQTTGTPSQGESGQQEKVSAEGDADSEAFEKMSEHFAEQDGQSQGGESQAAEGNSETDQSESQGETQSQEGDGEGSPQSDQASQAEGGQNQDQAIEGSQEGEQSKGSGAEGQPNEQREQQQADAEHKDEGEKQEAPGGKMSTEQGEQGAGNNPGENEGSMDTDSGRKSRDKSDEAPESEQNDEEAPGQSNSQQENDSKGSAGGDQSGGGQEGAGQQADAEGTGAAGENTAADDGAGQAAEQGAGENSSQAGQQGESDKPTGESSESKPGEGSKESDQPGGEKPGGEQQGEGGEPSGQPGEHQGEAGKEPSDQQGQPSQNNSPSTGTAGAQPPGAGTDHKNSDPPPPGELEPGDAANLDYARKQTDLVLDRLDDQLEKQQVDQDLLKKLGWTEEELRQFLARWKNLKAEAAQDEGKEQELDNTLRSLGFNSKRRTGFQSNTVKEQLRQLQDSYRGQTPLEYEDQVRAYIKGTATAVEDKTD